MNTITISKTKYKTMEKQSRLYKKLLQGLESKIFPIEVYTQKRIEEFEQEDKVDERTKKQIRSFLSS